jgi:hypothetical protein
MCYPVDNPLVVVESSLQKGEYRDFFTEREGGGSEVSEALCPGLRFGHRRSFGPLAPLFVVGCLSGVVSLVLREWMSLCLGTLPAAN